MTKSKNKNPTAQPDALDQDVVEQSPSRRANGSRRLSISNTEPSLTQQHFKASVDVNTIVKNYARTGIDPYENRKANMRFSEQTGQSFTEALYRVAEINSAFADLPAAERNSFSNDPSRWLDSIQYPDKGTTEIVPSADVQEVDLIDPPIDPPPEPPETEA